MIHFQKNISVALLMLATYSTTLLSSEYNTFRGNQLKFDSSLTLLGEQAPADIVQAVHAWCQNNPHLVRHFSGHEAFRPSQNYPVPPVTLPNIEDRKAYFESVKKEFADAGFPTLSPSVNLILRIKKGLLLKAAGYLNMQQIINASLGNAYGQKLTIEDLKRFENELGGKTYQTATRFMGHLGAEKSKKGLYSLENPERYLVKLSSQGDAYDPCDGTCVVIEREVEGKIKPLENSLAALNPTRIEHIVRIGATMPLWSMGGNNFCFAGGAVHVLDTEFPNNLPAQPGSFISKEKYQSLVQHGWAELETKVIQPAAQKYDIDVTELLAHKKRVEDEIRATWAQE